MHSHTSITMGTIVELIARGSSRERILQAYPLLEPSYIDEALAYVAWRLERSEKRCWSCADDQTAGGYEPFARVDLLVDGRFPQRAAGAMPERPAVSDRPLGAGTAQGLRQ